MSKFIIGWLGFWTIIFPISMEIIDRMSGKSKKYYEPSVRNLIHNLIYYLQIDSGLVVPTVQKITQKRGKKATEDLVEFAMEMSHIDFSEFLHTEYQHYAA